MPEAQDMDCTEVKELLSAYYDHELSSAKRTAVADHLAGCSDCAQLLEGFRELSALAAGLAQPESPAYLWNKVEEQLDMASDVGNECPTTPGWLGWTSKPVVRLSLGVAATILIAVGWFSYKTWFEHGDHHHLAAVFGQYLAEFRHDPDAAQQILLANYQGQVVDAQQAERTVGYRPVVADGLPEDFSLSSTYVMKMPCCTCVQCLCKRSDGTTVAIFEHDDKESDWFGDRPESREICNGTSCRLVELGDQLAASWKCGKRYITVIGVRDTAEVGQLVAWFDKRRQI